MKKRILAVVTAAVLALGCFSAVSASYDSPKGGIEKKALTYVGEGSKAAVWNVAGVAAYNGANDDFEITEANDDDEWRFVRVSHLLAQYPTSKYKIIRIFNLESDVADDDEAAPVIIADIDVKGSKKYALARMNGGTAEWSGAFATGISSKDGLVKFNATKTGLVALLEIKGGAAATPATDAKAATTTKTAPKTGEV